MTTSTKSRQVRITILIDNQAGEGLKTEHGFALWIDTGDKQILFDTGQSGLLLDNAASLHVDLNKADTVILSHGHYDHTGGLAPLLSLTHSFDLYCHPAAVYPRYAVRGPEVKSLQMPRSVMSALDRFPQEQLHWIQQPLMIAPGIGLTGPIIRHTDYEDTGGPFFLDQAGQRPDPIDDDMALWIATESGLIVCVGCAHSGLVNTLRHIQTQNPGQRIRAIIGGFHLASADNIRLQKTVEALREFAPDQIIPCHCTGPEAIKVLHQGLGKCCHQGMAGMRLSFTATAPMAA